MYATCLLVCAIVLQHAGVTHDLPIYLYYSATHLRYPYIYIYILTMIYPRRLSGPGAIPAYDFANANIRNCIKFLSYASYKLIAVYHAGTSIVG